MIHVSIDIETFDKVPGAALASVGVACGRFVDDMGTMDIVGSFHRYIIDREGSIDPQTIRWHLEQDRPAFNVGQRHEAEPLAIVLDNLAGFLHSRGADREGMVAVWSHATFDIPILAAAYNRRGRAIPWHYRNCRDLRTLYDLAGGRPKVPHGGKHNALEDAYAQLEEVRVCLFKLQQMGVTHAS